MITPIGEDMPISCEYCYFWHQSRCTRGSEGCFYLMKIKRRTREKTKCIDCPYAELLSQKKADYAEYYKAKDEYRTILTYKANLAGVLGIEETKDHERTMRQHE